MVTHTDAEHAAAVASGVQYGTGATTYTTTPHYGYTTVPHYGYTTVPAGGYTTAPVQYAEKKDTTGKTFLETDDNEAPGVSGGYLLFVSLYVMAVLGLLVYLFTYKRRNLMVPQMMMRA